MMFHIRHWWHSRHLGPNELCACWVSVGYIDGDKWIIPAKGDA